MVGWTLVHEAYFYLIAALALWIVPRRHHTLCLGGWAAVTMALNIYATDAWPAWLNLLASPFTLEFIVGIMLGKYWRCLPSSLALPAICVAAIILATAAMGSSILDPSYGHHPGRVAILGIVSILVVLSLVQLEASSRITPPAALVAIGNWSFSIGLSHIFVTSMMARVWRRLGPEMPLATQAVSLAAFVAASLLIGWASYRYLEQPFARWSKVMAFPRPHVAPR
jgi:peptidoglycan/LPS O-acetylase OafA/YrhL